MSTVCFYRREMGLLNLETRMHRSAGCRPPRSRRRGQGVFEWGLLVVMVAILAIAGLGSFSDSVNNLLTSVSDEVEEANAKTAPSEDGEFLDETGDGGGVGGSGGGEA